MPITRATRSAAYTTSGMEERLRVELVRD